LIADVLEDVVRLVIEDGIRAVGVGALKVVTFGRYRSDGRSWLVEGGIGLVVIAAAVAALLMW
jgi:hypothetical protein